MIDTENEPRQIDWKRNIKSSSSDNKVMVVNSQDARRQRQQRHQFVSALRRAIDLEQRGDVQKKKGRHSCAARRYRRAIDIETQVLGPNHPHTIQLRLKLTCDNHDSIDYFAETNTRRGSIDLLQSFLHEQHGDEYRRQGRLSDAITEYGLSLSIEQRILGSSYSDEKYKSMIEVLEQKRSMKWEEEFDDIEEETIEVNFSPKGFRKFHHVRPKRKSIISRVA